MHTKRVQARVFFVVALITTLLWSAGRLSIQAATSSAPAAQNADPALVVVNGLSVNAGDMITVPIRFQSGDQEVAGIGLSLDFDQACLAFDETDADQNGLPDAVSFDMSPQFFPSVSYSAEDVDGEIDFIIADYTPPLAALDDSEQLISVRFTAVCQPTNAGGDAARIDFSSEPVVSFSGPNGQNVSGSATGNSVLILPQPDFTPQPTPTATRTATPVPSATSTLVPVPGNRPPTVGNDAATTNEDTSITIDVLQNDSDPDGDELLVDLLTLPAHGSATVNADGTVAYLPQANFNGSDSLSYTASDGRGGALSANVNIIIRAVNDPPVILVAPNNQTNQTGDAVTLLVSVNDVDSAQEALSFTVDGLPSGITLDAEQALLRGTIADNAAGTYTVVITISDGELQDSVQFRWTVTGDVDSYPVYLPLARH